MNSKKWNKNSKKNKILALFYKSDFIKYIFININK